MTDMGTSQVYVRTKVTSKVTLSTRLVEFSFRHLARSALRPFGIAPNDVRHSARSTSWGCKVPTHLALPGPSAAAACTAFRSPVTMFVIASVFKMI